MESEHVTINNVRCNSLQMRKFLRKPCYVKTASMQDLRSYLR